MNPLVQRLEKPFAMKNIPTVLRLGVKDFGKLMYAGQPEWSLLTVRAPLGEVAEAFVNICGISMWKAEVPLKPAKKGEPLTRFTAVVQLKGNPWTVILRSLFEAAIEEVSAVDQEARTISSKLKTKAISFISEGTSNAMGYSLYDQGQAAEVAQWNDGGDFISFSSKRRKVPDLESVTIEFSDDVFREHGVYIPACYPRSEGGRFWLAVCKPSIGAIERADLIQIGERPGPKPGQEVLARLLAKWDKHVAKLKRRAQH
jgi:hypothetical protein